MVDFDIENPFLRYTYPHLLCKSTELVNFDFPKNNEFSLLHLRLNPSGFSGLFYFTSITFILRPSHSCRWEKKKY